MRNILNKFKTIKQLYGHKICALIPLDVWHRLLDVDLVIPHWHLVSDSNVPHVSGLYKFRNVRQFKADLEFFLQNYTPVSLQDIINHLYGGDKLPKRAFIPTFDDGFREVYDVIAPILHMQGIPAVFLLITAAIDNRELCYSQKKSLIIHTLDSLGDSHAKQKVVSVLNKSGVKGSDIVSRIRSIHYRQRQILDELGIVLECDFSSYVSSIQPYLTSEQIKNLIKMGFDIGAHSIDHPFYPELEMGDQLVQTWGSMEWLSTKFQYSCRSFAFPYDDAGISSEFFQKVFSEGNLRVTFGQGGLLHGPYPQNLPRMGMERTDLPAPQLLARRFLMDYFRKIVN